MRIQFLLIALLTAMVSWGQMVTIGAGTDNTNGTSTDPIDDYYANLRYQTVFTAAELSAAGLSPGASLSSMGFSVSESPGTLKNYTIKIGHTLASNGGNYIEILNSPIVVKDPFSYKPTVVAQGEFDMIAFDRNFVWNGTNNICIEICTSGNPFSTTSPYGGVRVDNMSNAARYVTSDYESQCGVELINILHNRPAIRFKYVTAGPCTSPPNGGITELSPNSGSPGSTLTASVNGASIGSGLTYQWQYSDNGSTWDNIAGQTSANLTTTAISTIGSRHYRRAITCSGSTAYSTPATFTTVHCTPTYSTGCSGGASIVRVKTLDADTNFDNSSSCGSSNGYSNYYNSHNITAKKEESFTLSVTTGSKRVGVKIWIDYNQNGQFESSELVAATATTIDPSTTWTSTLTIPSSALTGETRMRVRAVQNSTSFDACGVQTNGETEDYKITILPANPCLIPLVATASNIGYTSANLNWLATPNANYEVEWSTNSGFSTFDSKNLNSTQHSLTDLTPFTTYYYRVRSFCGTNTSEWSPSESFITGGYTPLEVSGFNKDVIANEGGGVDETTDAPVDAAILEANHAFLEKGYMGASEGLPNNRVVEGSADLKYLLQDYTDKNSLRMNTGGQYVLTLNRQTPVSSLFLSGTSGNGTASINVEVVYTEGESQFFNNLSLDDWQSGFAYVTIVGSKIQRNQTNPTPQIDHNNPKIHQLELNGLDANRLVKEIKFTINNPHSTERIANIFAVSAQPEWARTTSVTTNQVCSGEEITFSFSGIEQTGFRIYDAPQDGNLIASTTDTNHTLALSQSGTYYVTAYRTEGAYIYENPSRKAVVVEWGLDNEFMAVNGNWDSAANWSKNSIPSIETCIKVPSGKKLSVNVENAWAKNVTIENGGELIIEENQALIVQDFVKNNSSAEHFVIKDGASLVQIKEDAINVGAVKLEKNFNFSAHRQQYNFVSIPLNGFKLKGNPSGISPLYDGMSYVLKYNEGTDYFVNASSADYDQVGKGFAVKEASGNGEETITGRFTGVPFNGPASIPLAKIGQGFNVIGNPYPSTLDLTQFYADNNSQIEATVWFWDNIGNTVFQQQGSNYAGTNYATYNFAAGGGTGVAAPSGIIPTQYVRPGTGFMVQAKTNGALVNFNNAQRATNTAPAFVGKTTNLDEVNRYWLYMETPDQLKVNMAVVYFDEGDNGYGIDDSDAFGSSDELYAMVEDKQVIIQGKAPFVDTDVVPLGFRAFKQGNYKIEIPTKEGVFEDGQKIYLRDKDLGIIHDFSQGAYSFKTRVGEFNNRFEIVYKPNKKASQGMTFTNVVNIQKVNDELEISSSLDKISSIEIYGLNGRSLHKELNVNLKERKISIGNFNKEIIFVKLITEKGEVTTKKILNK